MDYGRKRMSLRTSEKLGRFNITFNITGLLSLKSSTRLNTAGRNAFM